MTVAGSMLVSAILAWLLTVPLHRFKELRPMTPRDVTDEAGLDIRAVLRHARCATCHHEMSTADVIPALSWMRGCPAGCGSRMPATVVVFQIGLTVAVGITAASFSPVGVIAAYGFFCVVVATVALIDARIWLIPWWMPWTASAIGLVLLAIAALVQQQPHRIAWAIGSGAGTFALFFVLWFLAPAKLGFGDVRLALTLGIFLGWLSPLLVMWGLLLGSALGVVMGLVSMASGQRGHFAFGPALGAGALIAIWLHVPLVG